MMNYSLSERSIYYGMDLDIESDPTLSAVSDLSTIGWEA